MTQRSTRPGRLERLGDRFLDLDSPTYGDERERAIVLAASSLGFSVGLVALMAFTILLALTGLPTVGFALWILAVLISLTMTGYAKAKGVDIQALGSRGSGRLTTWATIASFGTVLVWVLATYYWVTNGHGVLPVNWSPDLSTPAGSGDQRGWLRSMLVGAVGGGLVGTVWMLIDNARRRKAARAQLEESDRRDLPDED